MRVGLVTIYQVPNYGSVLQAFATQYLLERLGVECHIVNYKYPNEWHWHHGSIKPRGIRALIRRFVPSVKSRVLEKFRKSYYNFTPLYKSLDELCQADWSNYDAFVVGSDQVWNVRFVLGDSVFMLSFVPQGIPRFSLGSSFALKSLPDRFRDKYKRELSKFSALSVRESNGIEILNEELQIDKPVKVLLDPTLLLSGEEWLHKFSRSSKRRNSPYILLYMWTYAFEPRPYIFEVIKYFRNKMNCEVVALEGYTKMEEACGVEMQNKTSSTIPEFLDLFAHAELVVTSSFHGTAFALNFGVPLVSIVPDGDGDDRQTTLLHSLGCDHCAVKVGTPIEKITPKYNVEEEQQLLTEQRNVDLNWIRSNVLGIGDIN